MNPTAFDDGVPGLPLALVSEQVSYAVMVPGHKFVMARVEARRATLKANIATVHFYFVALESSLQ